MLKIKKTKPYQFRKLHSNNSSTTCNNLSSKSKLYISRVLCSLALICGIVPSLALLTYYNTDKTYAAGADITSISTMQEMKPYICDNTEIGTSHTLTDIRDNSAYAVAKLSDGKCWMTQNLKLDISKANSLSSNGTDIAEGATWPKTDIKPSIETEDSMWTEDVSEITFAKNPVKIFSNSGPYQEAYGYYYTWCAATAGTCTDVTGNALNAGNATGSICPKGWRLPVGGTNGEFQALYDKDTSTAWTTSNNLSGYWFGAAEASLGGAFFPATGFIDYDGLNRGNTHGYYWSSTASTETNAYYLSFDNETVYPANAFSDKYYGRTVRCIAEGWPSKDVNVVAVRVSPVISIDATSGMKEEVDPNKITTGTISATVSANTTYAVQLSANKTSLTNPNNSDTEITSSNSIPASTNVQAKTNAWGILNSDNTTYSAITTNPTTYYNTESTNEDSSKTHTFTLGVSVSPTLPAGEYSTTVTITAVNN